MASYLPYAPFAGQAPPVPQTAKFAAPDPTTLSPYGQFRLSQGTKAIERGAAARGTLLTGGLQTRLAEFGQGLASEEAGNDYQRALSTYDANRNTDQMNFGREQTGFNNALSVYGMNRDTAAQNAALDRPAPLATAAPAPVLGSDPQADYNAMLQRRQREEQLSRLADERRTQGLALDENAALSSRQLASGQSRLADEARVQAGQVADDAALAQRQLTGNASRLAAESQPVATAPAATGYQDMLAQYAEYQRQIAENERLQRAGSERQNAATNAPLDLAQSDARRRMLEAERLRTGPVRPGGTR